MIRKILGFLVLVYVSMSFSIIHPFHVAITTVNIPTKGSQIGIEIKVFYHDLEKAVNQFGKIEMDIKNHTNSAFRDSLVFAYCRSNFSISSNNNQHTIYNSSIKFQDEYIFIQFMADKIDNSNLRKKMQIENTICYEIEETQTNLFNVIAAEKKTSKKIINPESMVEFEY